MALRVTEFLACENILGESDFSPLLSGPQAAEEGAFHCLRSYSVGWGGAGRQCVLLLLQRTCERKCGFSIPFGVNK